MEWSNEDDVNCGITHLKNEDLIVAVVMISKWKLLKTEEGDLKGPLLCRGFTTLSTDFSNVLILLKKVKTNFGNSLVLLLSDELL